MHANIICAFGAIDLAAIYRVEWDCFVEALRMRCGRISKVVCPSLEPCTYTCLSPAETVLWPCINFEYSALLHSKTVGC